MVILGAKGHALEIMDVLLKNDPAAEFCFFDNISQEVTNTLVLKRGIIRSNEELTEFLKNDNKVIIGTGNPQVRKKLADMALALGGNLTTVFSNSAYVSSLNVIIESGSNIMHQVIIHPEVIIGEGSLINCHAIIHHESRIGKYCEICPGAIITGNVIIGDFSFIGSGAVILPGITIGKNAVIAAGAVVKNNIPDNVMAAGVPAEIKNAK